MPSFEPVRFGLIGSGWIAHRHLEACRMIPEAEVVACADYPRARPTGRPGRGERMASEHAVPRYFPDYREMLAAGEVEVVAVGLPNNLHAEVALAALEAGKHVVMEKPLCLTLEDADRIVRVARDKGLSVGYAEELCFCPKLVRAKALVDAGAIGRLFWLKQVETHSGPYSDWFFDPALAGGGALMDMGCHSIEYARWMYGKPKVRRVTAHLHTHVHADRGQVDDQCVLYLEMEGDRTALIESGWTLQGGMDSLAHLQGTEGVIKVDLLQESGISMFSKKGVASEDLLPGWTKPDYEWLWQNGYPQEMAEFARSIREERAPVESAEDGRAVLEVIWAAYASANEGRTVDLPYAPPPGASAPVDLWTGSS